MGKYRLPGSIHTSTPNASVFSLKFYRAASSPRYIHTPFRSNNPPHTPIRHPRHLPHADGRLPLRTAALLTLSSNTNPSKRAREELGSAHVSEEAGETNQN